MRNVLVGRTYAGKPIYTGNYIRIDGVTCRVVDRHHHDKRKIKVISCNQTNNWQKKPIYVFACDVALTSKPDVDMSLGETKPKYNYNPEVTKRLREVYGKTSEFPTSIPKAFQRR